MLHMGHPQNLQCNGTLAVHPPHGTQPGYHKWFAGRVPLVVAVTVGARLVLEGVVSIWEYSFLSVL